jgi:hypothetical protein
MRHLKKFNENESKSNHSVEIVYAEAHAMRTESMTEYIIDGENYEFMLVEEGLAHEQPSSYYFVYEQGELPFDLTDDLKEEMYKLYLSDGGI